MKRIIGVLLGAGCAWGAHAADLGAGGARRPLAGVDVIEVPGEDVFGFTAATDVSKPGDMGLALENDGVSGARQGRFRAVTQKLEASRTFAQNWSYAASAFGAWTSLRGHPDFTAASRYGFDGASIEVRHRLVERSVGNPFSVTLAVEPRWGRLDVFSGRAAASYGAEFKVQIDAPVTGRLFFAMNVNAASGRARDPILRTWANASDTALSSALAYAVIEDTLWIGAEARWEQAWSGAALGRLDGQAFFAGPTIAFKPSPNVTLNVVALPQIAGNARSEAGALDLDNFERAKARVKLAIGF